MTKILIDRSRVNQWLEALGSLADDAKLVTDGTMAVSALKTYLGDADKAITDLKAALAEPVQESSDMAEQLADALDSAQFYRRRCEAIQAWQSKMRDPERVIVCDILANGKTLDPAVAGDRYTVPRPAQPAQEPVRCPLCNYQYGHQIGCENNPVDIALSVAPPQRPAEPVQEALTIERLRDALVASRIVPPAAVEDPDDYDDGVTLHRIEALHRRLA